MKDNSNLVSMWACIILANIVEAGWMVYWWSGLSLLFFVLALLTARQEKQITNIMLQMLMNRGKQ